MPTDRRTFIKASAAVAGALGLDSLAGIAQAQPPRLLDRDDVPIERSAKSLDILILGGTGFTGPEQVEYAIARGHKVTLINRNRTRPDFFKGRVEQLIGDLNGDVSALKDRKFDVVIDNPTTAPAWVRNVAQYMKGNTNHYIFISTISAYANDKNAWADESDPTHEMPPGLDPYVDFNTLDPQKRGSYYGPLKAYSEKEVARQYPGMYTIIRPGLIVGPLDRSDRFTYWPYRIDKGGEVLAPGDGNDPVQIIDSRDIAEWTIRVAENRTLGTFNATGPVKPLTMAQLLYGIKSVTTAGAQFTWVPADFLREQGIRPWSNMPVWVPDGPNNVAFSRRDISKALAAGLTFRSLAVTAKDTLDWNKTRPASELDTLAQGKIAGISADREAQVLAAWKAKQAAK
ncbi:MAG TPA: NAD-dependent epimerase/dehydratase family protein [Gemmatimonadaceae bacterium]|jgi:2'-hydroxyisoflavone reductase|nr:NAD-dependent epimerase/dehydratase family protein [Gemmatimonadaceae bacterium]